MKRMMCVWFPHWPLQRIRYAQPEHKNHTIVLYADSGRNGLQVVSCCHSAAKRGIVTGMPLAEAKGLLGSARRSPANTPVFIQHSPADDMAGLCGLAVWCQRFSPIVGVEEPDSLLLDLTGGALLFGGEKQLSNQLSRALAQWDFSVRTAIADTVGTAWAMAHFGKDRMAIVPTGQQEAALRLLPVQSLRLPTSVIETLDELDIRRIEQLQALPRASLSSRLGTEVARQLDQALQSGMELIAPVRPPEPLEVSRDFEHPVRDRRTLEIVLRQLVERIVEKVAESLQGVQRLEVHFFDPAKRCTSFVVGTLRPCRSSEHLMELVQTRLDQVLLTEEVASMRLKAATTALLESHQNQLFDSESHSEEKRELAQLIDRLSNRLGKQRVVRPRFYPDAQPELSVRWEPMLDADAIPKTQSVQSHPTAAPSSRPLHLRVEPLAVEVTSVVPEGPPIRFFWKRNTYTVTRCWGPERIETGWWRDLDIRRDYYRVETESGQRFWLFRRIRQRDWFLHGEFE